jgi:hypothetical protein
LSEAGLNAIDTSKNIKLGQHNRLGEEKFGSDNMVDIGDALAVFSVDIVSHYSLRSLY